MAYELTCPACGKVVISPFIRAGAVARCGGCGHRYAISEDDFRRPAPPAEAAVGSPGIMPAAAEPIAAAPGLSGLSDLMKRHDRARAGMAEDLAEAAPPPEARRASAVHAARRVVGKRHRRRRRQRLVASVLLLVIIVGAAILGALAVATGWSPFQEILVPQPQVIDAGSLGPLPSRPGDRAGAPSPQSTGGAVQAEPAAAPAGPPPVTDADLLPSGQWRRFASPVLLPPSADDPIRVVELTVDGRTVVARVVSDSLQTIDHAVIRLAVVNDLGRAIMSTELPVVMLEPLGETLCQVVLPGEAAAGLKIEARARVESAARQVTPMGLLELHAVADPDLPDGPPLLEVRADGLNDQALSAARAVVLLEGRDRGRKPVGTWRMEQPLDAHGRTAWRVRPQPALPGVVDWTATGYALH